MFANLRSRLLFSYIIVISVTLCIVGTALLFILLSSPLPARQTYQRLTDVGRTILPMLEGSPDEIDPRLTEIAESAEVRILRISPEQSVLFDSAGILPIGAVLTVRSTRPTQQENIQEGLYRDSENRAWLFVAFAPPSESSASSTIVFAALRPRAPIFNFFGENMLRPLAQAAIIGLVLAIILALVISSSVAGPLRRTAAAAHAIASGDYTHHAPIEGPTEVQELGRAFNAMAQQVQRTQQTQRDFLANVSHELKTPLTSIQGYAQAILDGAAPQPGYAARVIYDEAARMHRLVEDLLDLARIESGQTPFSREHVQLTDLLTSVMEHLSLRASKSNVRLMHSLNAVRPITGDNDRLAQVFTNLIDNAITHTPSGGEVRVSAMHAPGGVQIAISDTGKGIPAEDKRRIFERFYQVDKSRSRSGHPGTGLGLTISKEIVEVHGGRIHVESVEGAGTTFVLWLPAPGSADETVSRLKH
jgi:two-component system, OmpR family, sensor kinase